MPPTKTFSDWWPILARDEHVSVRGDYVSTRRFNPQLTLSGESKDSGLRRRMTMRGLQRHFERRRDAEDNDVNVGNCLNATEIRIIPSSALSRTYRRPIQMREEDMTRFLDTKGKWGKDHVITAAKGAWVARRLGRGMAFADIFRIGITFIWRLCLYPSDSWEKSGRDGAVSRFRPANIRLDGPRDSSTDRTSF